MKELTLPLGDLAKSINSLAVLATKELPIRQSFLLAEIVSAATAKATLYGEKEKELITRYAVKDEQGVPIAVAVPNQPGLSLFNIEDGKEEEFNAAKKQLDETMITIPGEQISMEDLASVSIAPAHLMSLTWLIKKQGVNGNG